MALSFVNLRSYAMIIIYSSKKPGNHDSPNRHHKKEIKAVAHLFEDMLYPLYPEPLTLFLC